MKNELTRGRIIVKKSPIHGYGVFADQDFQKDELIEECYFLEVQVKEAALTDYYFTNDKQDILSLGYGSIYNHADDPNVFCEFDFESKIMCIQALRPIHKGEEIFISYGRKWFVSRGITPKAAYSWRRQAKRLAGFACRFGFVVLLMAGMVIFMHQMIR